MGQRRCLTVIPHEDADGVAPDDAVLFAQVHPEKPMSDKQAYWPAIPLEAWQETCNTLHLWTQIVGKIRLACMPWINDSWHVALYVTPAGLRTDWIPLDHRSFEIVFDFVAHRLRIVTSDGAHNSA